MRIYIYIYMHKYMYTKDKIQDKAKVNEIWQESNNGATSFEF